MKIIKILDASNREEMTFYLIKIDLHISYSNPLVLCRLSPSYLCTQSAACLLSKRKGEKIYSSSQLILFLSIAIASQKKQSK